MKKLLIGILAILMCVSLSAQVAITNLQPSRISGTLTTATGAGSTVSVSTIGLAVATVTVNGTYAGETINFEFSDNGTNWYAAQCTRTDTNLQETSEALPSNQSRAWGCGVYATTNFRVRSSAITSGTVNVGITLSAAHIEPAQTVALNTGSTVAATKADGADVTLGSKSDAKNAATDTTAVSLIALMKQISASVQAPPSQAVTGTITANAGTGPFPVGGTATGTATTFLNCDQHYVANALSTSGNTQIVALTSLQHVYVCGWYVNSSSTTAVTAKLVYGTGTACATGQTDLSIAVPLQLTASTAPAGSNISYGGMIGEQTPASQALCVNLSGAVAVNVEVLYTKF